MGLTIEAVPSACHKGYFLLRGCIELGLATANKLDNKLNCPKSIEGVVQCIAGIFSDQNSVGFSGSRLLKHESSSTPSLCKYINKSCKNKFAKGAGESPSPSPVYPK